MFDARGLELSHADSSGRWLAALMTTSRSDPVGFAANPSPMRHAVLSLCGLVLWTAVKELSMWLPCVCERFLQPSSGAEHADSSRKLSLECSMLTTSSWQVRPSINLLHVRWTLTCFLPEFQRDFLFLRLFIRQPSWFVRFPCTWLQHLSTSLLFSLLQTRLRLRHYTSHHFPPTPESFITP